MSFDKVKALSAYELVREDKLNDLKSDGLILKHKKSGARVCLISNDDENPWLFGVHDLLRNH